MERLGNHGVGPPPRCNRCDVIVQCVEVGQSKRQLRVLPLQRDHQRRQRDREEEHILLSIQVGL